MCMKKRLTILLSVAFIFATNAVYSQTISQLVNFGQGVDSKGTPDFTYHENYVYMLYTASNNMGRVCRYNLNTGEQDWSGDLFPTIAEDDAGHNGHAITVDGDGYIHCWIGMHNHKMKYYRSNSPGTYNSFTDQSSTVPWYDHTGVDEKRYSYPSAATSTNGDVFVILRRTALDLNDGNVREIQHGEKQDFYHYMI